MRLFAYIFRRYCAYALAVVVLCLFLFVFFDFGHRTRVVFSKFDPPLLDVVLFYVYQLPLYVVQALPIAALLASVLTMLVLGRNNEITAMRAAGAGIVRLAAPLVVGGALFSALGCAVGEWLVPIGADSRYRLEARMTGKPLYRDDRHVWLKNGNTVFRYQTYDAYRQRLLGLKQIELRAATAEVAMITTAAWADYRGTDWLLGEVQVQRYDTDGRLVQTEVHQHLAAALPFKLAWLRREQRRTLELSHREIKQLIASRHGRGEDELGARVNLYLKTAYPCAALFVVLLGLRFGFLYRRQALRGVLATFVVGFAYWLLLGISTTLGRVGALTPLVAAWLANGVLLLYCLWQLLAAYTPSRSGS